MKITIIALACLLPGLVSARTLDTSHFKIKIACQNTEYEVGCDKASYEGTNKDTGEKIKLMGKQLMESCADGSRFRYLRMKSRPMRALP